MAKPAETWFDRYVDALRGSVTSEPDGSPVRCPCCSFLTLSHRGGFDICPVCFWEDDGQDEHDASVVRGGPNGSLSLTAARANYLAFGAVEERFISNVRKPKADEIP